MVLWLSKARGTFYPKGSTTRGLENYQILSGIWCKDRHLSGGGCNYRKRERVRRPGIFLRKIGRE